MKRTGVKQVAHSQDGGDDLTSNGSQSRTGNTPLQHKNRNGVQDHIQNAAHQGRQHSKFRTAIRPDNGVKAVCHDIKGDADDNNIEIIDGIGEIVLCGTKSRQNHIPKQDKQHHQHRTADQQQGDRVAHTAVGALGIMLALANTQKSCTAVTNHQGYCQRDDRDGKDHIGCTVAQISYAPANENLVHNIVQGRDQQGENTGNSKFQHQAPNRRLSQITVGCLLHRLTSLTQNKASKRRVPKSVITTLGDPPMQL